MNAGDTFLLPSPYNHLYVAISDPARDPSKVVLVNFTTYDVDEEDCCIVRAGEHPFVTRKSCVRYKDGRVATVAQLERLTAAGQMKKHKPVSRDLLARIREGAMKSDFLPEGCRNILEEQGLI